MFRLLICCMVSMQVLIITVESDDTTQKGFDQNHPPRSFTDDVSSSGGPANSKPPGHDSPYDPDYTYHPYLLVTYWSPAQRLLMFTIIFFAGFFTHSFLIWSFFSRKTLQRVFPGNIYLACTGLGDFCVLCGVAPTACYVLLRLTSHYPPRPEPEVELEACHFVHFIGVLSTYINSFFFALAALEQYARFCWRTRRYGRCMQLLPPRLLSIVTLVVTIALAYADVYLELNVDYCDRKHQGNFIYVTMTTVMCHLLPACITILSLVRALFKINNNARVQVQYKRSRRYATDVSMAAAILVAYLIFAIFWAPHVFVSHMYPNISNNTFYVTAWIGAFRSVFSFIIYVIGVKSFQDALKYFFRYLCFASDMPPDAGATYEMAETALAPAPTETDLGLSALQQPQVDDGRTPDNTEANTPDSTRVIASTSTYGLASNSTLALTSPQDIEIGSVTPTETAQEENLDRTAETASAITQIHGVTSICTQTEGAASHSRVASASRPNQCL